VSGDGAIQRLVDEATSGPTIAERFPVRAQGNGTAWYRSAPVRKDGREGAETLSFNQLGWTSNPGLADPSYGVGDGKGNAF
jgi:hypothetical protein